MKTLDLRQRRITLEEVPQTAGDGSVRIVDEDGGEFILEAADAFEREVAELGRSEKFLRFLAERSREPGRTSLEDIEGRLNRLESFPESEDSLDPGPEPPRLP